ncbi:hypothetical protein KC845_00610 [Candidatus Kaiserbacteria bacterium]|nr:hypothetical protein [Candidatus Kaiserbacteria bacterium]
MEWILILVAILQSMAISLGVGSSTTAILNFFVAIKDGKIDPQERNIMGVTYAVLRVSMVLILITTITLALKSYGEIGNVYFSAYNMGFWLLIFILYTNATLMTLRIMPSTFGPALQASTWYTLGIIYALIPLGLTDFTLPQFLMGYVVAIFLAISIVNGTMAIMKAMRDEANPSQK